MAEPLMNSFPMQPQVLLRKPTLLLRVSEQNPKPPPTSQITIWEGERERDRDKGTERVREVLYD